MAESSTLVVCLSFINTVTHVLIGSIACIAFVFANRFAAGSFNQHIYLCVTGYIILMSQAIMTISSYGWTGTLKYDDKKVLHIAMQIIGSTLAIAGSILRISNLTTGHFQTAHGTLGILAFIFTTVNLIGGIITQFTNFNPKFVRISHACVGCLTVTFAFLSYMFGIDKVIFRLFVSDVSANMLMAFTVIALIGTLIPACINIFKRLNK